jgi:hypothetical protein
MKNIKSLEQMEKIVKSTRSLSWDGWDVLKSYPNPTAWRKPNARYIKGRWFTVDRYPVTENGWIIPESALKDNYAGKRK